MRELGEIQVLRGVTHFVEPRTPGTGLRLSAAELPLGDGVGEILAAHVANGLRDTQARAAKFVDRRADRACGQFQRLLGAQPRLVQSSQRLAELLYGVAEEDERVSDGTLAVLLCQGTGPDGAVVRFPAVLKLDPSATLRATEDQDPATGGVRLRYVVDTTSLPSKREKIQKCVFVRAVDDTMEFEMLVVDRQRRADVLSRFWVEGFLGAEPVFDATKRTQLLYRALKKARNEVEDDLDAGQLAALAQVFEGVVVQQSVNVDDLVAALPVPDDVRQRIDAVISAALPDREFDLDQDLARRFVRRRSFVADNGIRLVVPADYYDRITVQDLEPGNGDEPRRRLISFETTTWQET